MACGDNMGDPATTTGVANGITKVLAECNLYGTGVPTDQPRRYCFASCLDETWTHGHCNFQEGACSWFCDPAIFQG